MDGWTDGIWGYGDGGRGMGMAAGKGWVEERSSGFSEHRQARESEKIRIPSPLARSKRRPAGTGDVARRLACHAGDPSHPSGDLQAAPSATTAVDHRERRRIVGKRPAQLGTLPSAHASLCHGCRDEELAVEITHSPSGALIRRLDDAGCAPGVGCSCKICILVGHCDSLPNFAGPDGSSATASGPVSVPCRIT